MRRPAHGTRFTDHQSDIAPDEARRGRPPFPREAVLAAADELFARAEAPRSVSMDDVAEAAGIGKGTLFRAFGSRANMVNSIFDVRIAQTRSAIESGAAPLGPGTPPADRVCAILAELLRFKLSNRYLTHAIEQAGSALFDSDYYRWIHGLMTELVAESTGDTTGYASYTAHILLGSLRTDLGDHLLDVEKASVADLINTQTALARRLLEAAGKR